MAELSMPVAEAAPAAPSRSQAWLVWRAFCRHRLALVSLVVTVLIYLVAIFADFLAPYDASYFKAGYAYAPPQLPRVSASGLYVYGYRAVQNPDTLALTFQVDESKRVPLQLFARGGSYRFLGVIPTDVHLLGPADRNGPPVFLLGADSSGHDLLSRIIHGATISMSIGLVGVAIGFLLGIVLGGVSGYFGGRTDTLLQRVIEIVMSFPTLPLWLGLAAALPGSWGPVQRYFVISLILSTIAWTGLARVVRGRFMSLREEDFVTAARLDGAGRARIIFRHMLPSFTSYLIAHLTLSIPAMILAETSLSFLGLGLQPPVVSWGVLLEQAQNVRALATAPWLLLPGAAVVISVLALNFVGDGLRDAADPYSR